jgi:N-acetylmuramoyl-L-alanine amidase
VIHRHRVNRRIVTLRFLLPAILAAGTAAHAAVATYTADVGGATRVVAVQTQDIDGVEYVPLLELVNQLGGSASVLFSRVQVDMGRRSAYLPFGQRDVETSGTRFRLRRPIVQSANAVLMARSDVTHFFSRAFEVAVREESGPTVAVPITPRAPRNPAQEPDFPLTTIPMNVPDPVARQIRRVVLDPGHGGLDSGATGRTSGLQEHVLTLSAAKIMRDALGKAGLDVVMTRDENANLSIAERAKIAADKRGDLIVSIHAGTSFAPNAHGIEIFYPTLGEEEQRAFPARSRRPQTVSRPHLYTEPSRRFAQVLAATVRDATAAEIRGIHGARLRLHKSLHMPGVLIEIGMLSNQADEALLEKETYLQNLAQGLVKAIEQFNHEAEAR